MPDYVLKHKSKGVAPYVLSLPNGATDADLKDALAMFGEGWSLDKSTDPNDVPPPLHQPPTAPAAPTKENT
jgi:hypothetical protein